MRPHPACPDGEEGFALHPRPSFTIQASWMGSGFRFSSLSSWPHSPYPGEPDGVLKSVKLFPFSCTRRPLNRSLNSNVASILCSAPVMALRVDFVAPTAITRRFQTKSLWQKSCPEGQFFSAQSEKNPRILSSSVALHPWPRRS